MTRSNRNFFSHSSRGQMSETTVFAGPHPLEALGEAPSHLLQLPVAVRTAWIPGFVTTSLKSLPLSSHHLSSACQISRVSFEDTRC